MKTLLPVLLALALAGCIASGAKSASDYYDRPVGLESLTGLAMVP